MLLLFTTHTRAHASLRARDPLVPLPVIVSPLNQENLSVESCIVGGCCPIAAARGLFSLSFDSSLARYLFI